jgi:hypothetical protein
LPVGLLQFFLLGCFRGGGGTQFLIGASYSVKVPCVYFFLINKQGSYFLSNGFGRAARTLMFNLNNT